MMPKKWRGTLLYLGILAASVGVVGVRMLPVAGAGTSVVSGVPSGSPSSPLGSLPKCCVLHLRAPGVQLRAAH